jgi:hypothetical protein
MSEWPLILLNMHFFIFSQGQFQMCIYTIHYTWSESVIFCLQDHFCYNLQQPFSYQDRKKKTGKEILISSVFMPNWKQGFRC